MATTSLLPQTRSLLSAETEKILLAQSQLLSPDELNGLRTDVIRYGDQIRAALRTNEFIDIKLVERITECLTFHLDLYAEFLPEQQKLIVGAARYFIQQNDAEPDTMSVLGFDDDVEVLNYVLEKIGHAQFKVNF